MGLQAIVCLSLLVACASASYYYSCPTLFNFYPDSNDCTKFYRCVWGKPVRFSCAPGTRWSQHLLTCDHASKVPCGSYPAHPQPYQPEPVYPTGPVYPNAHHAVDPIYVPAGAYPQDPDYYQYVSNFKYANNNGYPAGYHKK